jgi:hypothetical protein
MESTGKPRVIKDYENLSDQLKSQVMMSYPDGFSDHLISYTNRDGMNTHGILYEVEDRIYFIRMNSFTVTRDFEVNAQNKNSVEDDVLSNTASLSEAENIPDEEADL